MESKIKKNDGVHSKSVVIAAKQSIVKKSIKKAVAKEDTKMAVYADSTDSSPPESALMEKINAADHLKQKLAQTINKSMTIRNNPNHLEVHVSGPFQNNKSGHQKQSYAPYYGV